LASAAIKGEGKFLGDLQIITFELSEKLQPPLTSKVFAHVVIQKQGLGAIGLNPNDRGHEGSEGREKTQVSMKGFKNREDQSKISGIKLINTLARMKRGSVTRKKKGVLRNECQEYIRNPRL
jgi:hypothetical protein